MPTILRVESPPGTGCRGHVNQPTVNEKITPPATTRGLWSAWSQRLQFGNSAQCSYGLGFGPELGKPPLPSLRLLRVGWDCEELSGLIKLAEDVFCQIPPRVCQWVAGHCLPAPVARPLDRPHIGEETWAVLISMPGIAASGGYPNR